MNPFLLVLFFSFMTFDSEAAGLRCFDLFAENTATTAKKSAAFYAEVIDELNAKYGEFIFQRNLTEVVNPNLEDATFGQRTRARYQAYRLKKTLKSLYALDQFKTARADEDIYAIEKIASKLEKLTFLTDESVTARMTIDDKISYREGQHSLFAGGLQRFLFTGEPPPPASRLKKVLTPLRLVFKDVYFRWLIALARMPQLEGAVIPFEVIEKVVLEGYADNQALLKPYLLKTHLKSTFNIFASAYNVIMIGVMAVSVSGLAHHTYNDVYLHGVDQAVQMMTPVADHADKLASFNAHDWANDEIFQGTVRDFVAKIHRAPSREEIEMIKKLIAGGATVAKGTP